MAQAHCLCHSKDGKAHSDLRNPECTMNKLFFRKLYPLNFALSEICSNFVLSDSVLRLLASDAELAQLVSDFFYAPLYKFPSPIPFVFL